MQIVQPSGSMLPNQASAGVGAVIFDKPQYDPLTVQMRVNAELDDFAKQKQAQAEKQKADTAKLVADLNFDAKGIYDQDNDFFIDGKRKLIDANAKLYSLEPNTQAFRDAEKEAKRLQGFYSVEAQASAMHKDMLANAIKDFDPTKHDKKYFDEWIVGMRTAASIEARNKVAGKNPFMPIQKTLEEKTLRLFDEAQKAGLVKPIAVKQEYGRTPDGEGILIEKEEILPENKSLDLAQGWLANSDIKDDVLEQYSQLPESEQSYYLNRAKELSQKYSTKDQAKVYDPISVYYSQSTLDKYNVGSQKRTQLGFSPKQQQEAEFMYSAGEQDVEKAEKLMDELQKLQKETEVLAETLIDLKAGNPFSEWDGYFANAKKLIIDLYASLAANQKLVDDMMKSINDSRAAANAAVMAAKTDKATAYSEAAQASGNYAALAAQDAAKAINDAAAAIANATTPEEKAAAEEFMRAAVESQDAANVLGESVAAADLAAALAGLELANEYLNQSIEAATGQGLIPEVNVTVNVSGNVTTEQDLVETITDQLYQYQKSGKGLLYSSVAI